MSALPISILDVLGAQPVKQDSDAKNHGDAFSALLSMGSRTQEQPEDRQAYARKKEISPAAAPVEQYLPAPDTPQPATREIAEAEQPYADPHKAAANDAPSARPDHSRPVRSGKEAADGRESRPSPDAKAEQAVAAQQAPAQPENEKEAVPVLPVAVDEVEDVTAQPDAAAVSVVLTPAAFLVQLSQLLSQLHAGIREGVEAGDANLIRGAVKTFMAGLQQLLSAAPVAGTAGVDAAAAAPAPAGNPQAAQPASVEITVQALAAVQVSLQSFVGSLAEVAVGSPDTRQYDEASLLPLLKTLNHALSALSSRLSGGAGLQQAAASLPAAESAFAPAPLAEPVADVAVREAAKAVLAQLSQVAGLVNKLASGMTAETIAVDTTSALPSLSSAEASAPASAAVNPLLASGTQQQAHNPQSAGQATAAVQSAQVVQAASSQSNEQNTGGQAGKDGQPSQPLQAIAANSADAASRAAQSGFAKLVSASAPAPVIQQVAFHIKTAVSDGSSKIHIQLDPAHLGKLDIRLHVLADGKTAAVITADNKETLAMLQKDSAGLERALSDAGLKTDSGSLSFNLRGEQHAKDQDHLQASGTYRKASQDEEEMLPAGAVSRSYLVNLADGLDITI